MEVAMGQIVQETEGRICVLTIDNQQKRNAITHAMAQQLLDALRAAEADPHVRVVVITGAGGLAFSSGHDLGEPLGDPDRESERAFGFPRTMRKPVIAAITGHCHAAGLMLAVACDIRVADETARIGSPGAKLGGMPVGGQLQCLPQYLSPGRAKLFMMTSMILDGTTAKDWGLVDVMDPGRTARELALDIARTIAANSPTVIAAIKAGTAYWSKVSPQQLSEWEKTESQLVKNAGDWEEGVKAFLEKRAPVFADLSA
jgi:enoyl-CoA hydratase/carnithine racemase